MQYIIRASGHRYRHARHIKADLVLFDPAVVDETAPRDAAPAGKPNGIARVFINRVQVVDNGDYIPGVRGGEIIRV